MNTRKVDWNLLVRIILSVITFGWGWLNGNQTVVIGFVASVIVWVIGLALKNKWEIHKTGLTIILFFVALALELLFTPVTLPDFPNWAGDIGAWLSLLITWFSGVLAVARDVIASATLIYNILLEQVLKEIPPLLRRVGLLK